MKFVGLAMMMLLLGAGCAPAQEPVLEVRERSAGELTEASCQAAGGLWEDCGSACRGEDVEVCVDVCVEYCECESDVQCPEGFACGEFIDDMGVCIAL